MAQTVTCPTLTDVLNADQCNENYAGVAQTAYFFVKSDLSAALSEINGTYSTPSFKSGKGLYKVDCKEESNKIEGGSLGFRKGFKITATIVAELVNAATAKLGRAINNLDIGIIVKDGDVSQILYDPDHKIKFDADGIKTDTGAAAADDRTTTLSATLSPVKYPNLYVTEPSEGGWDSLLASANTGG